MPSDRSSRQPTARAADTSDDTVEMGYGEALAELEEILDDLDRPDVDVDELSLKVRRASILIRHCRERISSARLEIEQVVADLGDADD